MRICVEPSHHCEADDQAFLILLVWEPPEQVVTVKSKNEPAVKVGHRLFLLCQQQGVNKTLWPPLHIPQLCEPSVDTSPLQQVEINDIATGFHGSNL